MLPTSRSSTPGTSSSFYTDGVYDGSDEEERRELEELIRAHSSLSAEEICAAVLERAASRDQRLRDSDEADLIDKTVFVIKQSVTEP